MSMILPEHLQKVVDTLWRSVERENPENVYAILDAARDKLIYPEIQGVHFDIKSACLYEGEQARDIEGKMRCWASVGDDGISSDPSSILIFSS